MYLPAPIIYTAVFVIVVSVSELISKSKEARQAKKDWQFCKMLLDETRKELSEKQLEEVYKRVNKK